ncbi:DUF742 domain-containing protein [Amycolatopsis pigmentata]|uniref:DUF742 domain-containing protein n=1 Tax=Amycolatopsis pigmentata TaxID=450801 RepID=A0ABW5FYZ6_9PSEU
MTQPGSEWYGDESGPMVRLYALTRGRARPAGEPLDMIALVLAGTRPEDDLTLSPEQATILTLCRDRMLTVAEIAAKARLPLSVIRVLLADLQAGRHIQVMHPTGHMPDEKILREVLDGLRAL